MSRAAASAPLNCILRPVPGDTTDTDNEDCASGLTFHISPQICTRTVMTTASTGVFVPGVKWSVCFKYLLPTLCRFRHSLEIFICQINRIRNSSDWGGSNPSTQALPVCGYVVRLSCWRSLPLSPNVAMPQFVIIGPPLMVMRRVIGSWKEIGWWRGRRWNCSQIDPHHAITHWANWSDLVLIEKQKTFPFQFW